MMLLSWLADWQVSVTLREGLGTGLPAYIQSVTTSEFGLPCGPAIKLESLIMWSAPNGLLGRRRILDYMRCGSRPHGSVISRRFDGSV